MPHTTPPACDYDMSVASGRAKLDSYLDSGEIGIVALRAMQDYNKHTAGEMWRLDTQLSYGMWM